MKLLKKISAKTVCGPMPPKGWSEKGKDAPALELYRVAGMATGVVKGETQYGEWKALTGKFQAINCGTGEVSVSGRCHLPEPLISMIAAAIESGEQSSAQFAVLVGLTRQQTPQALAQENDGKGAKHEYTTVSLMPESEADPVAALAAKYIASGRQLPAASTETDKGE